MKNVLIICGTFPPQSDVGGLRPAMFAKYLPEFGWNPLILTREYSQDDPRFDNDMPIEFSKIENQIFRIQFSVSDEIKYLNSRSFFEKVRDFFFPEFSNPPGLYFRMKSASLKLLQTHKFDLIYSTSPDQWELTLGAWISKKFCIPLVADFRDIKEQEDGINRTRRSKMQVFRFLISRYITTRNAVLITTISEFHTNLLKRKLKKDTALIYNGFDDENFKPLINSRIESEKFKIIYIGRILDIWYRDPTILLVAIDQLIKENKISENDICVEFYGTEKEILDELSYKIENKEFIKLYPRISHEIVPAKLNEAQILLLLTNRNRNGILTTKFFEYAGIKKTILCIPGDGNELDELISKYKLGHSFSELAELKLKIEEWIKLYKNGQFPEYIKSDIAFFTRKNQTSILAKYFDSVISK